MKLQKKLTALALSVLIILMSATSLAADSAISLTINGVLVGSDTNGNPCTILNIGGQTFASVRPILEFLDFEVQWKRVDGADRVDALTPGEAILENANVPGVFVNGMPIPPDSNGNPAVVLNQSSRVFVPIRALLEYLGLEVTWQDGNIIATTAQSALSGAVADILEMLISQTDPLLGDTDKMPMSFTNPVSADNAQNMLGLSPEQFDSNVTETCVSVAAIGTFAHQVALIKCNDKAAAAEVKAWVAAGFDATKWICVFPEKCFAVDSGNYVLMAATTAVRCDKLLEAFASMAGTTGKVDTFFSSK